MRLKNAQEGLDEANQIFIRCGDTLDVIQNMPVEKKVRLLNHIAQHGALSESIASEQDRQIKEDANRLLEAMALLGVKPQES